MLKVLSPRTMCLDCSPQRYVKAICASLLLLTVSCTRERSSQVELSLKVEPSNRPGVFTVSGQTNVPDQSQVIIQGIRPLTSSQLASTNAASNYAILDRQTAVVSKGQWQATLKLWQSTPDGQYQEVWQSNQIPLRPGTDVVFVAAIDPGNQSKALKQTLEKQGKSLEGANVHFTTNEQWYLQAKQTLTVTPPTGKTASSELNAKALERTLSNRSEPSTVNASLTQANLPILKEKQTTAPLAFSQRFR